MYSLKVALCASLAIVYTQAVTFVIDPYPGTAKGNNCKGKHYKPLAVSWTTANGDSPGACVQSTAPPPKHGVNSSSYSAELQKGSTIPAGYSCVVFSYSDTHCGDFYEGQGVPTSCVTEGDGGSPPIGSFQTFCTNQQ